MRTMKKTVISFLAIILLVPSFLTTAADETKEAGFVASKDEVVYATLQATGDAKSVYVVNTLDVTKAGKVIDYGPYTNVINLTDLSKVEQMGDKVQFTAPEGKFYYQGTIDQASLPWDFNVSYFLNGQQITPEDLIGADGHLEIKIETTANESVDQAFFENYLLQISLTFESDMVDNLLAEDGLIANAGKDRQVTFTLLPEQEEDFVVAADVIDFEFDGIEIAGVPSTMSIDAPEVDEMTGDIKTLADAIADVNNGVADLKYGVATLSDGAGQLYNGSGEYQNGVSKLSNSSAELIGGSKEINEALKTMSSALNDVENIDLSDLQQLSGGLTELAKGLKETSAGLTTLQQNYNKAYKALDGAMEGIPAYQLSEKEIQALYESGANKETIDKLTHTYSAAQTAKGTYNQVKQAFAAVDGTLQTVIGSLNEMAKNVNGVVHDLSFMDDFDGADGIYELKQGITSLSASYKNFHTGLLEYTDGVGQLASSEGDVHDGIGKLSSGTSELKTGVSELHKGTAKLKKSTQDLPEQMTEEIDEMIGEYDKSDFDAISFVSDKNEDVYAVQFVFQTESIKHDEKDEQEEQKPEKKGFWTLFKELFS